MNEFELIRHYFESTSLRRTDVPLGIGDDCALLAPKAGYQIAVTTDTMVEGVHFDKRLSPSDIGYKLMAVNLSDLASMGAEPSWISLALTLPKADEIWLAEFSRGLAEMAKRFGVSLIGGDTTRGPLTLTVTAQGQVPSGQAMRRDGAQIGDLIFVSGTLGDAALALRKKVIAPLSAHARKDVEERLFRPQPRVELGASIRQLASACIDISDGLAVDLAHILKRSKVGAVLDTEKLPISSHACHLLGEQGAVRQALAGGDDYELCFTVPPEHAEAVIQAAARAQTPITCIGKISQTKGLSLHYQGQAVDWHPQGYLHFQ